MVRWCVQSGVDMHAHSHCGVAGAGAQQGCRQAWAPPSAGRRAAPLCGLQQLGNLTASLPAAPASGTRRLCTRSALPTSAAPGSVSKLWCSLRSCHRPEQALCAGSALRCRLRTPCTLRRQHGAACRAAAVHMGSLSASGLRFGCVVARFNDLVTKPLLEGVLEGFERHGTPREEVDVRPLLRQAPAVVKWKHWGEWQAHTVFGAARLTVTGRAVQQSTASLEFSEGGCGADELALRCVRRHMQVAWVPGSFELAVVAKSMAKSGRYDAVITVGAVVRPRARPPPPLAENLKKRTALVLAKPNCVPLTRPGTAGRAVW